MSWLIYGQPLNHANPVERMAIDFYNRNDNRQPPVKLRLFKSPMDFVLYWVQGCYP